MKKIIGMLLAMLLVLPVAFAGRVSVYGDVSTSSGDAVVGDKGYIDLSEYGNSIPDVFVCATKDGKISSYGMNLQNDNQIARAIEIIKELARKSFAGFDHFGCLRAKVE